MFGFKHQAEQGRILALLSLMFEAKHRPDPPRELIEASEKAFSRAPAAFAEGQAIGDVVPGDPARLSIVVFSASWVWSPFPPTENSKASLLIA